LKYFSQKINLLLNRIIKTSKNYRIKLIQIAQPKGSIYTDIQEKINENDDVPDWISFVSFMIIFEHQIKLLYGE